MQKKIDKQSVLDILDRLRLEAWNDYDKLKKDVGERSTEASYCWGKITALRIAYFDIKYYYEKDE